MEPEPEYPHRLAADPRDMIRVTRGLSAIFWGLPLSLLICVRASASNWLKTPDAIHPVAALALVCYGTWQLGYLRNLRSPSWSLEWAKTMALVQVGLAPFIYFWNHQPDQAFFGNCMMALALVGLSFLLMLNQLIRHWEWIFSDQLARAEIRLFSRMNAVSILLLLSAVVFFFLIQRLSEQDEWMAYVGGRFLPLGFFILLVFTLLPLTMTMTMTWKIKEELLHLALNTERAAVPSGPPPLPEDSD